MRIIIVEDNLVFREYISGKLSREGYRVSCAGSLREAKHILGTAGDDDVVLADLRLPDGDGIGLLDWMRKTGRHNPSIIMTDYDEVPTAVQSMRAGAMSYFSKKTLDMDLPPLLRDIRRQQEKHTVGRQVICDRESKAFQNIGHSIKLVAPTNMSVLILGENGTGKEHIAEKIHAQSRRRDKPFVAVDCGTLSPQLAESALFGHVRGAFTGAEKKRTGYFGEAKGGTLFLDEVGNLSDEVQRMLLRAIQSRRYRPQGAEADMESDVRIIAATNEDLPRAVAEHRFRQDLYYRLREFTIAVPPLRKNREDIMPLAGFFLGLANREFGKCVEGFGEDAEKALLSHTWPGNVRELKQAVFAAVLMAGGEKICRDDLTLEEPPQTADTDHTLRNEDREREQIMQALEDADWNREAASSMLGVSRTTLYKKMMKYGIPNKKG